MKYPLKQTYAGGHDQLRRRSSTTRSTGTTTAKQKAPVTEIALAFNELLPIIPICGAASETTRSTTRSVSAGWPADGDGIYKNPGRQLRHDTTHPRSSSLMNVDSAQGLTPQRPDSDRGRSARSALFLIALASERATADRGPRRGFRRSDARAQRAADRRRAGRRRRRSPARSGRRAREGVRRARRQRGGDLRRRRHRPRRRRDADAPSRAVRDRGREVRQARVLREAAGAHARGRRGDGARVRRRGRDARGRARRALLQGVPAREADARRRHPRPRRRSRRSCAATSRSDRRASGISTPRRAAGSCSI